MLIGLVAIAAFIGEAKTTVVDQAELVRIIRAATDAAVDVAPSIDKIEQRLMVLSEAANALQGPDDGKAVQILDQAWKLSNSKPGGYGIDQVDIVHAMAAIDPTRGQEFIAKIGDKYWRDFANRFLPGALTIRHPHLAEKLFLNKLVDQDLYQELSQLCSLRIDMAVSFLRMFPDTTREDYAVGTARYLNPKDAAAFLTAMKLKRIADPRGYWLTTHPNPGGQELERGSAAMAKLRDRIELKLAAIAAYRTTNSARGKALADELCDQANSKGPLPVMEMSDMSLRIEWKYLLVPEIAQADTPKVRAFLDKVYRDDDGLRMQVVGAWSEIDVVRATKLADECKEESAVDRTDIGSFVNHGYCQFLVNLAKIKPEDAGKRMLALRPTVGLPGQSGNSMADVEAIDIVKRLWKVFPEQAKRFCAQFPVSNNLFGTSPARAIDVLQMDKRACADPLHSEPLLKKIVANCPQGLFLLGVTPTYSVAKVMAALAVRDQDSAIRMSSVLTEPGDRVSALVQAYKLCPDLPPSKREKLLTAALDLAPKIRDKARQAFSLDEIGEAAKTEWQRMQPWPPATE